jgi:hypothetical protein
MEFRRSCNQEPLAAGVVLVGDFVPSVANPGCEPSSAAGIHSLLHFDAFGSGSTDLLSDNDRMSRGGLGIPAGTELIID